MGSFEFFFFFEILFEKWNSLFLNIFEKNKISFKISNFLEIDIIYLIFWEILEFLFYFFNHSFIYFFIIHSSFHFIIFFLKEIYFFWWWVDWVNSIKHELTQKLIWGFNWGGRGEFGPLFFVFSFFFYSSSSLFLLPPLSLFTSFFLFSSFPHHFLLRKSLL